MGRTKTKTRGKKKIALGPRTGATYEVEDFEEANFIVIRALDGSVATLSRRVTQDPQTGHVRSVLSWHSSRGNPPTLHGIAKDFLPEGSIKTPDPRGFVP